MDKLVSDQDNVVSMTFFTTRKVLDPWYSLHRPKIFVFLDLSETFDSVDFAILRHYPSEDKDR